MSAHFADRLQAAIQRCGGPLVVGIDPVLERLPEEVRPRTRRLADACQSLEHFGQAVIDAIAAIAPAVKINSAFFEAFYAEGFAVFFRLIEYAHERGLLVIGDVKRGDIGSTSALYARGLVAAPDFEDHLDARVPDAVTLSAGYLGENAVRPFIDAAAATGRGLYVLVRPSDPGADRVHEFRGGSPGPGEGPFGEAGSARAATAPDPAAAGFRAGRAFYEFLADQVSAWGAGGGLRGSDGLSLVGAVVAPKDAASTSALRARMPHTPWLVPGFGAQGASARDCSPCFLPGGRGAIVNASRAVIYAYADRGALAAAGGDWRKCITQAAAGCVADLRAAQRGCPA